MIPFAYIFSFFGSKSDFHICTLRNDALNILYGDPVDNVDVVALFEASTDKLGRGAFGLVKKAPWGSRRISQVAIKKVQNLESHNKIIYNELVILNGLKSYSVSPALIACVQDGKSLYMVQELVDGASLDDDTVMDKIINDRAVNTFPLFHQGFKAIETFFKEEMRHNDIKPSNVIINKTRTKVYFVDFGLASYNSDPEQILSGTPGYISKGRFQQRNPSFLDDMYSWTISMAVILTGGEDKFFSKRVFDQAGKAKYHLLNNSQCFKRTIPDDCRAILMSNAARAFNNAGYGEYRKEYDPQKINLTTLLTFIVKYDSYPFTLEQTMQILERIGIELKNPIVEVRDTVTAPKVPRHRLKQKPPTDETQQKNLAIDRFTANKGIVPVDPFYSKKAPQFGNDEVMAQNAFKKKLVI
jgi:serine/threonine protein kinase